MLDKLQVTILCCSIIWMKSASSKTKQTYSGRFNSPCVSKSLPSSPRTEGFEASSVPPVEAKTSSWKGPAQVVAVSSPCRGVEGLQGLGWYQLVPNWLTALGRGALQRANLHCTYPSVLCSLSSTQAHEHTFHITHKRSSAARQPTTNTLHCSLGSTTCATSTHLTHVTLGHTLHKCNQRGAMQRVNLNPLNTMGSTAHKHTQCSHKHNSAANQPPTRPGSSGKTQAHT